MQAPNAWRTAGHMQGAALVVRACFAVLRVRRTSLDVRVLAPLPFEPAAVPERLDGRLQGHHDGKPVEGPLQTQQHQPEEDRRQELSPGYLRVGVRALYEALGGHPTQGPFRPNSADDECTGATLAVQGTCS